MALVMVQRCSGGIPVSRGTHPVRGRSVPYMVRYVRIVLPGMCVMWEWLSPRDLPGETAGVCFGGLIVRRTTVVFADRRVWSV